MHAGPVIDYQSQALNERGQPFTGPSAENATAAPTGSAVLASAMTLGLAKGFGWQAGTTIATGDTHEH